MKRRGGLGAVIALAVCLLGAGLLAAHGDAPTAAAELKAAQAKVARLARDLAKAKAEIGRLRNLCRAAGIDPAGLSRATEDTPAEADTPRFGPDAYSPEGIGVQNYLMREWAYKRRPTANPLAPICGPLVVGQIGRLPGNRIRVVEIIDGTQMVGYTLIPLAREVAVTSQVSSPFREELICISHRSTAGFEVGRSANLPDLFEVVGTRPYTMPDGTPKIIFELRPFDISPYRLAP